MNKSKNIYSTLKRIRTEKFLTQQEMADLLFVSKPTYVSWERDIGKLPLGKFARITTILNLSTNIIFEFISCPKIDGLNTDNGMLEKIYNEVNSLRKHLTGNNVKL